MTKNKEKEKHQIMKKPLQGLLTLLIKIQLPLLSLWVQQEVQSMMFAMYKTHQVVEQDISLQTICTDMEWM